MVFRHHLLTGIRRCYNSKATLKVTLEYKVVIAPENSYRNRCKANSATHQWQWEHHPSQETMVTGGGGETRHEWHFCELIRKFPEVCFLSIQTATTTASKLGSGQQLFQSALVWGSVLQYTLLQRAHTSAGGGISPAVTICRRNTDRDGYRFQLQKNLLIYSLVQEQLSHLIDHIVNHILV